MKRIWTTALLLTLGLGVENASALQLGLKGMSLLGAQQESHVGKAALAQLNVPEEVAKNAGFGATKDIDSAAGLGLWLDGSFLWLLRTGLQVDYLDIKVADTGLHIFQKDVQLRMGVQLPLPLVTVYAMGHAGPAFLHFSSDAKDSIGVTGGAEAGVDWAVIPMFHVSAELGYFLSAYIQEQKIIPTQTKPIKSDATTTGVVFMLGASFNI